MSETDTPSIAVIGLGLMGTALARAQLEAGAAVAVWNRSPEKTAAVAQLGAKACGTPADAMRAADVVVVCLTSYDAWYEVAADADVAAALSGRILVQLSTGTASEAEAHAHWARDLGARVLDGNILAFPRQIGTEDGLIVLAGDAETWEAAADALDAFGGDVRRLGADVRLPCVVDAALLSSALGTLIGTIHGAALAEAGGVPLAEFADLIDRSQHLQSEELRRITTALAEGRTEETEAALKTWGKIPGHMLHLTREHGIDPTWADGLAALFERAEAAGLGDQDLAAMIQIFRPRH
jgi:3-hydroxyisobutyrate dehydrogenase-like beta-hydroxyacid dehydrogenase